MSSSPRDGARPGEAALTERFYRELHALAARAFAAERNAPTLQPTAVVHEVCLRLLTTSPLPDVARAERLALAARVLRQVLVDHHRARAAEKRGGAALRVELDPELAESGEPTADFAALHAALERLRALHARQAEVVTLRAFGGLTMDEVAAALGVSKRTAEEDWAVARAWLRRALAESGG
jgi:RNA polymerase sigma factor (TIGR02999 family)